MALEGRQARLGLNFAADKRSIQELHEIRISEDSFADFSIADFLDIEPVVPDEPSSDLELCEMLGNLTFTFDELYTTIRCEDYEFGDAVYEQLDLLRLKLLSQLCVSHESMEHVIKYREGSSDCEERFDVLTFTCLLECVACMQTFPAMRAYLDKVVPKNTFPQLCKQSVIKPSLQPEAVTQFSALDMVDCIKYLEYKWCFVPYTDELPLYVDTLLARFAEIYKNPQERGFFSSIADYHVPLTDTLSHISDRMVEDFCFAFRPIYQKLRVQALIGQRSTNGDIPNEIALEINRMATQNAREMNNKTLTEKFRGIYARYVIRPSEIARFHRDKKSAYAEAVRVMKHSRAKSTINVLLEKLDASPWAIVDPERPMFDKTSLDIMHILLLDTMLGNMWELEWMQIFVRMNLDLLATDDLDAVLNVSYPLIVQNFNHFNVWHNRTLYVHNSAAKSFLHWLRILLSAPYNGYYDGKRLDSGPFAQFI